MAEHKACADLVALTGDSVANTGECRSPIDDSGTESGEDFRLLSPEILAEVQSALTRLEAALPGLDPVRREALIRLVNRLQSCLKLQPASQTSTPLNPPPPQPPPPQPPVRRYANRRQRHQRHTVGVSKEELADARKWLQETRQQSAASTENPSEAPSVESQSSTNLNDLQEDIPKAVHQVFRPVKFDLNQSNADKSLETVNQFQAFERSDSQEESNGLNGTSTYPYPQDVSKADSGSSLLEYDPSLSLFTPAQSVQIAVHKAAINKQISEEESKRGSSKREESYDSEDGDVSSVEDNSVAMGQDGLEEAISSAQRLLQIASDNKSTSSHGRFQDRNSKKQKMKRANTIDIPKPVNTYDGSSPDEFSMASGNMRDKDHKYDDGEHKLPPAFEPKTESDLKFLAFLQKANSSNSEVKAGTYNPSARGGLPWTNRFVNIKTAFEKPTSESNQITQNKSDPPPITQNWLNNSSKLPEPGVVRQGVNRTPQPLHAKLPWTTREEENGVVVGSLTVKPSPLKSVQKPLGPVNKFSHAPKSAFKPIEKKPLSQVQIYEPTQKPVILNSVKPLNANYQSHQKNKLGDIKKPQQQINNKMSSSASGSVKQLATQKFSGENIPSKPVIKQYPVIQDKQFNAINSIKQHPFVEQIYKPADKSAPSLPPPQPPQFSSSIATAQKHLIDHTSYDAKMIKIPQTKTLKEFKDGTKCSPPKQFINSPPPLNKHHLDPFCYPSDESNATIFSATSNHQNKSDALPEINAVPYYSQEPAYVQHTSYIQPYDDFTPHQTHLPSQSQYSSDPYDKYAISTEPVAEYPATYNQPEQNCYFYDGSSQLANEIVQPHLNQAQVVQTSIPYVPALREEPIHHRFSEESLVPNPLVLSDMLKSPVQFSQYDVPSTQPSLPEKPNLPAITNTQYENNSSHSSLTSSKLSDSSSSMKQYLNVPYEYGIDRSPAISNNSKSPYFDESLNSSPTRSPHLNPDDDEEREISLSEGTEIQTAVARVMGHAQCQKAVTVPNRRQHRFEEDRIESESLLRTLLKSPHSPTNMARKQSLEKSPDFTDAPKQTFEKPTQSKQYQDAYSYPSVAKIPAFNERAQPQKPSSVEKHSHNRQNQEAYSYPAVTKTPVVVTHQNDRMTNSESKPISSAASAFRPFVNNLAKPQESLADRLPPIPSSSPNFGRKQDVDNSRLVNTSIKISSQNSSYSSRHYESDILPKPPPSASPSKSPTLRSSTSPSYPNVLQKSESWHQLVKEQKSQGRHPPPKSPRLAKTKSSHSLAFPKQFEAHLTPDTVAVKQFTVDQYLKPQTRQSVKTTKQKKTVSIVKLDENLENVDEAFESLFQEVAKRK